jgi:hypothetical protein
MLVTKTRDAALEEIMDAARFDFLTKRLSSSAHRRTALGAMAGGGLLGVLGLAARTPIARAAQPAPCLLDFVATVRMGPSLQDTLTKVGTPPGEVRGALQLVFSATGGLDQSSLHLPDGGSAPVVGQTAGNAMQFRINLGPDRTVVASGVGEQVIAACQGAVDGLIMGPKAGDIGDWHAEARRAADQTDSTGSAEPAMATTAAPTVEPTADPTACALTGESCISDEHCCVGLCLAGICVEARRAGDGGTSCALPGEACLDDGGCCTGTCLGGRCVEQLLPGEQGGICAMPGEACQRNADCCTLSCLGAVCA